MRAPLYVPRGGTFLVSGLSIIGQHAYVVEQPQSVDSDGTLVRVPLEGGASSAFATLTMDSPPGTAAYS